MVGPATDRKEQSELGASSDGGCARFPVLGLSGDVRRKSRRVFVSQPQRLSVRGQQSSRVRPLTRARQTQDSTCGDARFPALPREFVDGRRGEHGRDKRPDAALGCARHPVSLRPRNRRFSTRCSRQSGRFCAQVRPNWRHQVSAFNDLRIFRGGFTFVIRSKAGVEASQPAT